MDKETELFEIGRKERILRNKLDLSYQETSANWVELAMRNKYVYNFDWLGRGHQAPKSFFLNALP